MYVVFFFLGEEIYTFRGILRLYRISAKRLKSEKKLSQVKNIKKQRQLNSTYA